MVYILLAPGFEEAEALVPADLLRRAGIETALTALEGDSVTGSHQITVKADRSIDQVDLDRAEMIVLPGGGKGVQNLGDHPAVAALVQAAADRNIRLAAICAAPTLLGRWGYLKEKQAVCYPGLEDKLTGARVSPAAQVVEDGRLITGQAAGAAFAFGLKLVAVLAGPDKAEEVRHAVCYRG
ncbi:MAG: DJ-1 family glyoxalase III [Lawsonibacter sp.]